MSSHHASVTRSPNHWCASSWTLIDGLRALEADRLLGGRREQDAARRQVISPAFSIAPKVTRLRDRELVELLVRVRDAEVRLEPLEQRRRVVFAA